MRTPVNNFITNSDLNITHTRFKISKNIEHNLFSEINASLSEEIKNVRQERKLLILVNLADFLFDLLDDSISLL